MFFKVLAAFKVLRVSREVELQGLDIQEMGAVGSPVDWEPQDVEAHPEVSKPGCGTPCNN